MRLFCSKAMVWGLFPFKTPLTKAIPMSHFHVCTHPGRHTHGYPRCTWVRERGGRLQMRDRKQHPDLQAKMVHLKLCGNRPGIQAQHPPPPVFLHVEARGGRCVSSSVTLHLRQGLSLNLELTNWPGWPPVSPRDLSSASLALEAQMYFPAPSHHVGTGPLVLTLSEQVLYLLMDTYP